MTRPIIRTAMLASTMLALMPQGAHAQSNAELQRQIDELKAQIQALTSALAASRAATPATPPPPAADAPAQLASAAAPAPAAAAEAGKAKADTRILRTPQSVKLSVRGYTQMRYNGFISGDDSAPAGQSRLRSVHDGSIGDRSGFSLRRARLVFQGDISDRVELYFQSDFAAAVSNQSGSERREHFAQLRDAYADIFLDKSKTLRLRAGQSKVPYGWENMQSSSNRLTIDRSDAINSAVPGERDLGVVAYYTPKRVQAIWDELGHDGQKLFGNYGAFGLGVFNGQGINRTEQNRDKMKVAFATWPFRLDGLGDAFAGQVLEIGGSAMLNKVKPEIRSGTVSATSFDDNRAGLHAILYPRPLGIQAEWNWGKGPQWDRATQSIRTQALSGGYVQMMVRMTPEGSVSLMPYARWQHYRGGWKAATNAPRLETDEFEAGVEWQPWKSLELTIAYARMKRTEADERRTGRAEGDIVRTQLQWNY